MQRVLLSSAVRPRGLGLFPQSSSTAAALIQVRGAKRRFEGNATDPYNYLKRKLRLAESVKFQRKPLLSNERMQKKIDLPYLYTSLSTGVGVGVCDELIVIVSLFIQTESYLL